MNFLEKTWMKKNAITANMWNLILAFAPNTTANSMKDLLKWMISVMTGANLIHD
jgi:hypothetical protein